jgi:hypothetical protein
MSNFTRKWAGPRFVEKPRPLTAEQIKWVQFKRENAVKAVFWLSLAAVAGLLLLSIGNFSAIAFLAVVGIFAVSAISSLS